MTKIILAILLIALIPSEKTSAQVEYVRSGNGCLEIVTPKDSWFNRYYYHANSCDRVKK